MSSIAMLNLFAACGSLVRTDADSAVSAAELARRAATPGSIAFILVVLAASGATFAILARHVPRFGWKLLAASMGVLLFETFTAPMWRNEKLGSLGYVYHDVSWILTLGWTALIMGAWHLVAWRMPRAGELPRFLATLLLLLPLVLIAENFVLWLGIRHYSPEVMDVLGSYRIGLVPNEALYYVPVFTALVLAFYRYWSFYIDDDALVPVVRTRWLRAVGLTVLAVVLFEVMIEPIVENKGLPSWSYFYRDLSFLVTGGWVLLIAATAIIVQRFLTFQPLPVRFTAALFIILALALPIESWLYHNGYRVYGPSARANFCGLNTWLTGVPIEIVMAIPMYMALVFAFIRYWEIVSDNGL
jgi:hypothetical protein